MTFRRDARGKVTRLTAQIPGAELSFKRISDQPPKAPEPPKPRAFIKLDTKFHDACVGQCEFAPGTAFPTGIKLTIWRQGDQLARQTLGRNGGGGEFDMYPESETDYFLKINGAQLTFIKNDKGEVTAVVHHIAGLPDSEGKKLKIDLNDSGRRQDYRDSAVDAATFHNPAPKTRLGPSDAYIAYISQRLWESEC